VETCVQERALPGHLVATGHCEHENDGEDVGIKKGQGCKMIENDVSGEPGRRMAV
jgi:hypothetical protein